MEKKTFMWVLISLILVLGIGLGIGYYVGKDSIFESNNQEDNKENISNKEQIYLESLGWELFNKINLAQASPIKYYYLFSESDKTINSKITKDKLSLDALFGSTIASIKNISMNYCEDCKVYELNYQTFLEAFHNLYGSKATFNYQNEDIFKDNLGNDCTINNNKISCMFPQDGDDSDIIPYIIYDSIKQNNDEIEIYVKGYFENVAEQVYYSHKTKEITKYTTKYLESYLYNNYKDLLDTYKLTFKKDSNNNYYWYETELFN